MARRRPGSANQLQRVVRAYAREYGLAEKRVRDWISYMAICGVLERAGAAGHSPPHFVKGGIALELRLPGKARATKDLDLGFRAEAGADLVRVLEDALAIEYEEFSFRRAREPHVMPSGAIRVEVAVQYAGGVWGRVVLDLNRHEGHEEIELVDALDLGALFGVTGPNTVPVLGLPWHVAHKIHAVSLPSTPDRPNDRVQDATDLLLLQPLITDLPAVRRACERVFSDRGIHRWPPTIALPPTWEEPYARLAEEFELRQNARRGRRCDHRVGERHCCGVRFGSVVRGTAGRSEVHTRQDCVTVEIGASVDVGPDHHRTSSSRGTTGRRTRR